MKQPLRSSDFPSTQWTLVDIVRSKDPAKAALALERLCQGYWYPIYAFVRRSGFNSHDAEDITQGFFAALVEHETLELANEGAGRLRSFLLGILKRHISDHLRHANAKKRGSGHSHVSFDQMAADERYAREPQDLRDPEVLFAQSWAHEIVDGVRSTLRAAFEAKGRAEVFDALEPFLLWGYEPPPAQQLADALGTSEATARVTVSRLRKKFREMLREEVARTVTHASEVDEEVEWLMSVISKR